MGGGSTGSGKGKGKAKSHGKWVYWPIEEHQEEWWQEPNAAEEEWWDEPEQQEVLWHQALFKLFIITLKQKRKWQQCSNPILYYELFVTRNF